MGNFRQQNHLLASYNIILKIFELILKKEKGRISPMILTKALQEQLVNNFPFYSCVVVPLCQEGTG